MTRQYFCWKVALTFRCGCVQHAPVAHRCPADREGCNSWQTNKRTDRYCEQHRSDRWGLTGVDSDAASSSSSFDESKSPSSRPSHSYESIGYAHDSSSSNSSSSESGWDSTLPWGETARRRGQSQGLKKASGGGEGGGGGAWEGYFARRTE